MNTARHSCGMPPEKPGCKSLSSIPIVPPTRSTLLTRSKFKPMALRYGRARSTGLSRLICEWTSVQFHWLCKGAIDVDNANKTRATLHSSNDDELWQIWWWANETLSSEGEAWNEQRHVNKGRGTKLRWHKKQAEARSCVSINSIKTFYFILQTQTAYLCIEFLWAIGAGNCTHNLHIMSA